MDFITLTNMEGHNIVVDIYNIAVVLPTDRTIVELYKGNDLIVQESVQQIKNLIDEARAKAIT